MRQLFQKICVCLPRHFRRPYATSTSLPTTPSEPFKDPDYKSRFHKRESASWLESEEDPDEYHPGGLHPINFGGTFNAGRYRILRKLGHGHLATVTDPSIVAVKIVRAETTATSRELEILAHVRNFSPEPDRTVKLIDEFVHTGINGRHQCLVFEPMGLTSSWLILDHDNLNHSNDRHWRRVQAQRYFRGKSALKDLFLGLHNLHSCGVASGNLHSQNFMTTLDIKLNEQSIPLLLVPPTRGTIAQHVVRINGLQDPWAPNYVMRKLPLREETKPGSLQTMKLGGLRGAFFINDPPTSSNMPSGLRAPEEILGESISEKIDIWAFGCLLYEFLTANQLFRYIRVITICPLHDILFEKRSRRHRYFGSNRELINTDFEANGDDDNEVPPPLTKIFKTLNEEWRKLRPRQMGKKEAAQVLALLRWTLQPDPEKRPTTTELLDDKWFKSINRKKA